MANRKLVKPTRCISSSEMNSSQPLINFGFLFKRDLHLSPLTSEFQECRSLHNDSAQSSKFIPQNKNLSDSQMSPPLIQYTALKSCAELIQSSIKDKHLIPAFFPYFNLLQKYKSGRSSSLSPVEMDKVFSAEFLAAQAHSQCEKNSSKQILTNSFNVRAKSKRSSSLTSFSSLSPKEKYSSFSTKEKHQGSSLMMAGIDLDNIPSPAPNEVELKSSAIFSDSDQDYSNLNSVKFLKKKISGKKKRCASCKAHKTPYWRDGWEKGVLLCNACGIRYQKYKRYCLKCNSIARKDEKGRLHCPDCNDKL